MKPQNCPWCGSKCSVYPGARNRWVQCKNYDCGATGPAHKTDEDAVAAWNQIDLRKAKVEPNPYPLCVCNMSWMCDVTWNDSPQNK